VQANMTTVDTTAVAAAGRGQPDFGLGRVPNRHQSGVHLRRQRHAGEFFVLRRGGGRGALSVGEAILPRARNWRRVVLGGTDRAETHL